jgi:TfoX/Sxy family transcriptional regulator of competence genes
VSKHEQQIAIARLLEDAVRNHQSDATFRWKPMFGGAGYYTNEVMFAASYGDGRVALKLPEADRETLRKNGETSPNSEQYITIPDADLQAPGKLAEWVAKSMIHVKVASQKKKSRKK